jgi:hypothetical protein
MSWAEEDLAMDKTWVPSMDGSLQLEREGDVFA